MITNWSTFTIKPPYPPGSTYFPISEIIYDGHKPFRTANQTATAAAPQTRRKIRRKCRNS